MSKRRRDRGSEPELLSDDDLPTEEHTAHDILTEEDIDDIDDRIKTVERRLPTGLFEQRLPRFEMTGTITLPRDFSVPSEPLTLPRNPPPVAPPLRVEPPPKPARPSLRSFVTPPPKPSRRPREDSFDHAPTPIRALPEPALPPLPRAPSAPPPPLPPARARMPSLPPPLPPPSPKPPALPPPTPPPRPASLPPPPRMPSAPPVAGSFTPTKKRKKKRPRPPEVMAPAKSDATRPFPLQAPRGSSAELRPEPSPSHTPPPLTASTPPPPAMPSEPPPAPRAAPVYSEPPPPPMHTRSRPSLPPVDRVPTPLQIAASYLRLPNNKLVSAAIGVFAALVVGMLVIMIAATLRDDPDQREPPASPVIAARPLGPARATATAAATATTPVTSPAPAPLGGCRLVTVPRRIAGPAMTTVVPMGAPAAGPSRVALGYASGRNHAEGAIVNLDDLSVEPRYSEEHAGPVFRVTPLADRSPVTFAVDRDDPRVQNLRTLPSSPPLRVGTSYFGFVRLNEATSPTVIWPGARFEGISEPAFAVTERDGYGVTFRTGRGSGDVLAGWLTPSGTADGDLGRIDAGAREVGAPTIAAGDKSVVVVFAARGPGEPWHLRVAVAPRGKVPTTSRELVPAQGGAPDAAYPTLVALSSGFLLQWLEGPAGARRVMTRTLDAKLSPQGLPLELAQGAGIQDAAGALVFRAGKVLAIHMAAADKSVELRGAVLVCG